jgi:hypothetical protein
VPANSARSPADRERRGQRVVGPKATRAGSYFGESNIGPRGSGRAAAGGPGGAEGPATVEGPVAETLPAGDGDDGTDGEAASSGSSLSFWR